jgi:hypothetical protein
VLAGCNSVLGLAPIASRDAAFYDAHVDAPSECPFDLAPSFDHGAIEQVLDQRCGVFTTSEDGMRAMALCDLAIAEGANDGSLLVPAPGLAMTSDSYGVPALGPDGMVASVIRFNADLTRDALIVTRDAGTWRIAATISNAGGAIFSMSQPTRGPGAHVIVDMVQDLHEFVDTGSGWEDRYTFTLSNYFHGYIQLSPDGLHAWWMRGSTIYYASRATMNDPFTELGRVSGADGVGYVFISADCGRIYFNTLDRIWRAPRT